MKRKTNTTVHSFFTEIIIVLLMFSLAAAAVLQFFAQGQLKARRSADLNEAVLAAQNAAECLAASKDLAEVGALLGAQGQPEGESTAFVLWYDAGWEGVSSPSEQGFTLKMLVTPQQDGLLWGQIFVQDQQEQCIFELETAHYPG
jgi:hypothetical protein